MAAESQSVAAERAMPTLAEQGTFVSPQALMAIKNLELRARVVVQGFWNGIHRSPYHGFSVEFSEYRQYVRGDDMRYLDWKLFARSDRYFIKKFEDETNLRLQLVVDNSKSMEYGSVGYRKCDYANTLAATLAQFLYQQGDAIGLVTFDEDIREYLPARHRTGHLRHVMLALEKPAGGKSTDLSKPFKRVLQLLTKRGAIALISDLLAPIEEVEKDLTALTASGHEIVVFQVLDPAELELKLEKTSLYRDIETGQDLYIDPDAARKDYKERLQAHFTAIEAMCGRMGATYHRLATDQPMEFALFDFLKDRMERDKLARKTRSRRSQVQS